MRRFVVATLAAGALIVTAPVAGQVMSMPGGGGDQQPQVSIEYADYNPQHIDVLAGDTIKWTNDSVRNHTVTDDGGRFDSGVIVSTYSFQHQFQDTGAFPYHCRLHPSIRGEVDVWNLLLAAPPAPAEADAQYPLHGRAALPADTPVSIEADDGSGAGFQQVATSVVQLDGHFDALVTPQTTARYRAVADGQVSPPVQLLVLNHAITAVAHRGRQATVVFVRVTPAAPHAPVVLQLNLRERFGWWPVAQAKLSKDSTARFVLHLSRDVSARARLTLPDGATALATSELVRVGPPRSKRRSGR